METELRGGRHDLRRKHRLPCDHAVTVRWRDNRGEDKFTNARALDICESGMRLQMPEAISRQAYVVLSAPKLGLVGHASVRHCAQSRSTKFAVGVEFTAGLRWVSHEQDAQVPRAR